jgi:small subunit ribosomal protein S4e
MKKHLKRLPAPRSWTIPRKTDFWIVRPSPGPHGLADSVPIGSILRDMLKVCDTAREARRILNGRGVRVDGRIITDPKFPVGLMDVLELAETKAHYRMLVNTRGRMTLVGIDDAEAKWKLCRVEDKTTVRGGKTQLNLHDGRNVLLPKDAYKTGTTLKIHVPDQKVVEHYELAKGASVLVTGGQHVGQIAQVLDVVRTRNTRANIVTFQEGFSTDIGKVFVVGTRGPAIKTPEVSALPG